jgi:hypothetical protein
MEVQAAVEVALAEDLEQVGQVLQDKVMLVDQVLLMV